MTSTGRALGLGLLLALGACGRGGSVTTNARQEAARRFVNRDAGGSPLALRDRPDLGEAAAMALATLFRERALAITVQSNAIVYGAHRLELSVRAGEPMMQAQGVALPMELNLAVDGVPAPGLRTAAVGREREPHEAEMQALREWEVGVGRALVPALIDRWGGGADAGAALVTLGPMRVFVGPVGMRGENTVENHGMNEVGYQRALMAELEPRVDALVRPEQRSGLHSFQLLMHVQAGRAVQGACRIDGQPSAALCDVLRRRTWPGAAGTDYLLRQTWVLVGP